MTLPTKPDPAYVHEVMVGLLLKLQELAQARKDAA